MTDTVTHLPTRPSELSEAELALALGKGATTAPTAASTGGQPLLDPPGVATEATAAAGFVTARVLSLFSSADGRNGWLHVEGLGWRRLAPAGDSGHTDLAQLGAAARIQGTAVPIAVGDDDLVHEIYVW
jgi:hypothetical protein